MTIVVTKNNAARLALVLAGLTACSSGNTSGAGTGGSGGQVDVAGSGGHGAMATGGGGSGGAEAVKDCPLTCMAHTCKWSGDGGPGWDESWRADPKPNHPTVDGVCTQHCTEYEAGKWLCGAHDWHKGVYGDRSVDCTGCADPGKYPFDAKPPTADEQNSLCGASGMTAHITWGTAIRACQVSGTECTVYQSLNGDAVLNPGRTCASFCASFGLSCLNGYDDGDDGCTYGGPGIGCDSVLGCCSVGGPTPDHVCACGP
jgi:hypothetical protein